MLAFAIVVVLGLAVGWTRGGRVANASGARLALLPLVWAALGLQVAAQLIPASATMVAYGSVVVSYAALFAFAGANWRVPGMLVLGIGAALNYLVILVNQGMPISAEAAARAGFGGEAAHELVLRGKHFVATGGDAHLMILGDIIPLWRQPAVASVGDVVIWAGLLLIVQGLMQPGSRRAIGARVTGGNDAQEQVIDLRDEGGTPRTGWSDEVTTEGP